MTAKARAVAPPDNVTNHADAITTLIARAAADPNVDFDRVQSLLEMQDRMSVRGAEAAFTLAMSRMQPKLPVLDENGEIRNPEGEVEATYAKYEDIVEAVRPILSKHGFALTFRPGTSPRGLPTVVGVLRHQGGHKEEGELELPADVTGGKNAVQAVGSSLSYGKRYVTTLLLNLTSRGDDDDGRMAGLSEPARALIAEIDGLGTEETFPDWKRTSRVALGKLTPPEFQKVIGHYTQRRRTVRGAA